MIRIVLHAVASRALINVECACGWKYRADKLHGRTDEEIWNEVERAYERHFLEAMRAPVAGE